MFGEKTIELLTFESSRYRIQMNKTKMAPITKEEMRQFIGIILHMSIAHLPARRDYWSEAMRQNIVADTMPVNRFDAILSVIHVNDNEVEVAKGQPGYDRLHKIRPLIKILQENFANCAEEEDHMSVDEQIVPFKGRHSLKVYMKKKPKKWGYKIWVLAGQSGYVYKFYISGDNTVESHVTDADPAIGKSGAVVLNLVKGLPHGIHVYFDNYFASPELLLELKQNGFDATCTIRSNQNRNCPLKIKKQLKKEGRGSFDYQSSDGIVIASWYDNTVVNLASHKCSVMPIHQVLRYSAEKKAHVHIQCPSIVKAYNKSMGGVDRCNMMLSFYRNTMKSRKWYKRLIFHLIDLCCVNAWTIRNHVVGSSKFYKFKLELARCLVQGTSNPTALESTDVQKESRSAKHVPDDIRL